MRRHIRIREVTCAVLMSLAAVACVDPNAPRSADDPRVANSPEGPVAGTLDAFSLEPAFLFPAMTDETWGSAVLRALFSPLVEYDTDTAQLKSVVATEIPTSADNIHWTIRLKDGWTFHNGEPVTAQSFVDAWNWVAYGPNLANNNYFFLLSDIVGYADLQSGEDPDADGPLEAPEPTATAMSGLTVVDDLTFSVDLSRPFSQFPLLLGYTAFYPLPAVCLADWEACNEAPIGNGPFMMEGSWKHGDGISVARFDEWGGEALPQIDGVEFVIFPDPASGYQALTDGLLDFMIDLPREELTEAHELLGDNIIDRPTGQLSFLAVPLWDARFGGSAADDYGGQKGQNLRHALSMAIDRQQLSDQFHDGAVLPAASIVPPGIPGYREDVCREFCTYDPAAARALYKQSNKITGPLNLWYFEGLSDEAWLRAIGDAWRTAFGINYELQGRIWADYVRAQEENTFDGPFRIGWRMDYPSVENYLSWYRGAHGVDNLGYANAEVDAVIARGDRATSVEEGLALYSQAEELILADMPSIPIQFGRTLTAYNVNVGNVILDSFGNLDLIRVAVTD